MLDSYCVIQFKDKAEKTKILSFLAIETEAEYKVTNDLKNFVSEKYNVRIVGKDENCCPKRIETITIKDETRDDSEPYQPPSNPVLEQLPNALPSQDWPVDIANPNDFIHQPNQLYASQYSSIPDPNVYGQYIPAMFDPPISVETQGAANQPDQHLNTPEPIHVEQSNRVSIHTNQSNLNQIHDDQSLDDYIAESDLESIGNDIVDNISVDDVLMANQVDVSSSSTVKRSGRKMKRPSDAIDDGSNKKSVAPTTHKRKTYHRSEKTDKCKVCETEVRPGFSNRLDHIFKHTSILRFECLVEGCGGKLKHRSNQSAHTKARHPSETASFRQIELTNDQKSELDTMMAKCFDAPKKSYVDVCQICKQSSGGKQPSSITIKKAHAYNHLSFMRFKCMEAECPYESKVEQSVKMHLFRSHGQDSKFSEIKLTREQQLEVKNIFGKCFPNS